jgi:hypothetical protein
MFTVCGSINDFALLIAKRIVSPVFFKEVEGFCYHRLGANVRRGREVRKVKKGEERGREGKKLCEGKWLCEGDFIAKVLRTRVCDVSNNVVLTTKF